MHNSNDWLRNMPIAHRGIFDNVTVAENSKTAIKKAIDANYAVELDVNITNDNKAVVFHDDKLSRMTNIDGYISGTNYEDIKHAHLLNLKDEIMSVNDVLSLVDGKVPILFNIAGDANLCVSKILYETIKDYPGEVAVESSNPYTLEWFKINAPRVKRGQRASAFKKEKPTFAKKGQLKKLKLNNISEPNFICYKVEDAKKRHLKKAIKENLPIVLYIVKDKKGKRRAEDLKANVIFVSDTI